MRIEDLLRMDMGELVDWLIVNKDIYELSEVDSSTQEFLNAIEDSGELSGRDMRFLKEQFIEYKERLGLVT